MRRLIFKTGITTGAFLCAFLFGACGGASSYLSTPFDYDKYEASVSGEEGIEVERYRESFFSCVQLIGEYKYLEAEAELESLFEDLGDKSGNGISALKADTEYALGRVNELKGYEGKAYDHYNSAYVYYRDLYGSDAPKTADALLKALAFVRADMGLKDVLALESSGSDGVFKNIGVCRAMSYFLNSDNKKEVLARIDKLIAFTKENTDTKEDVESAGLMYGEEAEVTFTLGRNTRADVYRSACCALADYYYETGERDRAEVLLEELLASLTESDLKQEEEMARVYRKLAFSRLYYGGEAAENEYIAKSLEVAKRIYPEGARLAADYINLGESFAAIGDYETFFEYLTKAQELTRADGGENNRTLALVYLRLADYYSLKSENAAAADYAKRAVDIYEALVEDDTAAIAAAYNILANVYASYGEYDKVKGYYEKSVNVYSRLGMNLEYAVSLRNLALVTNNTFNNHNEAMGYARKAIAAVEEMDHSDNGKTIAAIYMLMADITRREDPEYSKIVEYSERAYECLQNSVGNTDEYFANYHYNLGNYLKDNYRFGEARQHLTEAEAFFKKIYAEEWQYPVDVLFDLGSCLYMQEDYAGAREYFVRAIAYENERLTNISKPEWCEYLEKNREKAEGFIAQIDNR